jgi:hypothetical protein
MFVGYLIFYRFFLAITLSVMVFFSRHGMAFRGMGKVAI